MRITPAVYMEMRSLFPGKVGVLRISPDNKVLHGAFKGPKNEGQKKGAPPFFL